MKLSKLKIISDRLDNIYRNKQFIVMFAKKNKSYILVKEDYIIFKVYPSCLKCQCMEEESNLCDHILFVLNSVYFLSNICISYLDVIENLSHIFKVSKDIRNDVEKIVDDKLNYLDCGICSNELSHKMYKYNLYQCNLCRNYVHCICMKKWIIHKKKKGEVCRGCIYCAAKLINSLGAKLIK